MKDVFLLVLCLFLANCLQGQKRNHFYYEIKSDVIDYGRLDDEYNKNRLGSDPIMKRCELNFQKGSVGHIPESPLTVIYIHALSGDKSKKIKRRAKEFDKWEHPTQFIHINWNPKFGMGVLVYAKNWYATPTIGESFGPIFSALISKLSGKASIICHSSGHRILKGILENIGSKAQEFEFENIIMAATDIDVKDFKCDFANLLIKNKFTIYTNKRDGGLKLAKIARKANAVGRNPSDLAQEFDGVTQVTFIDATKIRTFKDFLRIGHVQYKSNTAVHKDIDEVLGNKPIEQRLNIEKDKSIAHGFYNFIRL